MKAVSGLDTVDLVVFLVFTCYLVLAMLAHLEIHEFFLLLHQHLVQLHVLLIHLEIFLSFLFFILEAWVLGHRHIF